MVVPCSQSKAEVPTLLMELDYTCQTYEMQINSKKVLVNKYTKEGLDSPFLLNPQALALLEKIDEPFIVVSITGNCQKFGPPLRF
jgi:hypothetical protein